MAFVTADRVLDSSTSTGTGPFVVSGTPAAGYQTFSSVMSVGDTCYYSIQGQTTSEWEVGLGTYSSANTLTRTTIYSSSNAGSVVTFSAGTKNVFLTMAASRSIQLDASGNAAALGTPTSVNLTNATNLPLASGVSGTLPTANGGLGASVSPTTAGNVLFTADGSVWSSSQKIVRGTAVATTSGTSVTFTGIPSWAKRITVMFSGVSTNGSSQILVQVGAGSVTTTGYTTVGVGFASTPTYSLSAATTTGFIFQDGMAAFVVVSGAMYISSFGSNLWVSNAVVNRGTNGATSYAGFGAGNVTLGGTLDRLRLTTVNGTDTFDAGSVNILYE